jgi:hypothetical protein
MNALFLSLPMPFSCEPFYMAKNEKANAAPITPYATFDREAAPVNLDGLAVTVPVLPATPKVGVTVAMVVATTPAAAVVATGACVPWTRPTLLPVTVVRTTWGTVTALEIVVVVEADPLLWVQGTTRVV